MDMQRALRCKGVLVSVRLAAQCHCVPVNSNVGPHGCLNLNTATPPVNRSRVRVQRPLCALSVYARLWPPV